MLNCFRRQILLYPALLLCVPSIAQENDDPFAMTLEQLLDVEVTTASKNAQRLSDAPSIISVITQSELHQLGADTLAQALELLPGFTPLARPTGETIMVVRGLGLTDGVLLLIDGVTVNDAFDGSFDFYQRPVHDIERIEVIRGPGSALYGSYAVSAVVHVFTKAPHAQGQSRQVSIGTGSFNQKKFAASFNHPLFEQIAGLQTSGSFLWEKNDGDALTIKQDFMYTPQLGNYLPPITNPTLTPTVRHERREKFNGHFNLSYHALSLNFGHQQIITYPMLSHLAAVTEPDKTIKDKTFDRLSVKWRGSDWLGTAYWNRHESKLYGQSQPPYIFGDENQDGLNEEFHSGVLENFRHLTQSQGLELEKNLEISDSHQILMGLAYDYTSLEEVEKIANLSLRGRGPISLFPTQDVSQEFMPNGIERTMKALFVQDFWQVSQNTDVTLGLRYGHYDDFGTTINPRIALVRRISEQAWAKVLYAEAFKPPTFAQLFDATPTLAPSQSRGNSELSPTEIESFEVQFGFEISARLTSSLNLFNNRTENEIFFNATPGIEQWQNSGRRRSRGFEAELKGAFDGIDMAFVNYSYQRVEGTDTGLSADIHPNHRLNLGLLSALSAHFKGGLTLSYYSSPQRENGDNRARNKEKLQIGLTITGEDLFVPGFNIDLAIDNLLNQQRFDETEQALGLLEDIPRPGRRITLDFSYRF